MLENPEHNLKVSAESKSSDQDTTTPTQSSTFTETSSETFDATTLYETARKVLLTSEQTRIECGDSIMVPDDVKNVVGKLLETAEYEEDKADADEPWGAFAQWGASLARGKTKEDVTCNLRWQLELEILSQRAVNRLVNILC